MIFINRKDATEPVFLKKYRKKGASWKQISQSDKEVLRSELKKLQNSCCAYCETPLKHRASAHIDHFKPKSQFPELTYEWENLFLSCIAPNNSFCAMYKDDKMNPYKNLEILKPDADNPNDYFIYRRKKIEIRNACLNKQLAENTINRLNLNHPILQNRRNTLNKHLDDILTGLSEENRKDLQEHPHKLKELISSIQLELGFGTMVYQYFYSNLNKI